MSRYGGTVLFVAFKALMTVLQLVAVRLYLQLVGEDGYGAYIYVYTLTALVMALDPGWADACMRRLAQYTGNTRDPEALPLLETNAWMTLALGWLGFAIVTLPGLWMTIPGYAAPRWEIFAAFASGGVTMFGYFLRHRYLVLLQVEGRFDLFAKYDFATSLGTTVLSLLGLLIWRSPVVIVLANGLVHLLLHWLVKAWAHREKHPDYRPKLHRLHLREAGAMMAKEYPSRVMGGWGNSLDRAAVGSVSGAVALTAYNTSARIPEAVEATLQPVFWNALPVLSRKHANSPVAFSKAASSFLRLALALGCALVLIPSAAGGGFLRLWLGPYAPAAGSMMLLLFGAYRGILLLMASFRTIVYAAGVPQWNLLPVVVRVGFLFALVWYVASAYAATGVAILNVGLAVISGLLVPFAMRRAVGHAAFDVATGLKCIAITLIGVVVAAPLYYGVNHEPSTVKDVGMLVVGGFASALTFALYLRLRLVELPERMAMSLSSHRRFGRFAGWLGIGSGESTSHA